jgi:hypothetical protein
MQAYNPSTQEAKAEGLQVQGQLQSGTLSQKQKLLTSPVCFLKHWLRH